MELEMADQKILIAGRSSEQNPCGSDGWIQTPNVNHFPPVVFGMAGRVLYSICRSDQKEAYTIP